MPRTAFSFVFFLFLLVIATAACDRSPSSPSGPGSSGTGPTVTIVEVTGGYQVTAGGTGTFNFPGQSITIPDATTFDSVRFNWYTFQKTPTAFGRVCLLSQEYLGLPRDLGPSTAGYVGCSAQIANNQYVFPASVTLKGPARYWLYGDTQGSFAASFDTDIYPGGDLYVTGFPANPFRKAPASGRMNGSVYIPPPPGVFLDANFKLEGRVVNGG